MATIDPPRRPPSPLDVDAAVTPVLPNGPSGESGRRSQSGAQRRDQRAPAPSSFSLRVRWRRRLRLGPKPSERRLLAYLTEFSEAVERRIADLAVPEGELPSWAASSRRLLEEAHNALERGDLESGYVCFLAAQRAEIVALTPAELRAAATALHQEASSEKFGGWRGKAIVALLQEVGDDASSDNSARDPSEQRARLIEARMIRDESLQNRYRKIERLQQQLLMLGISLALTVGGIVLLASLVDLRPTSAFTMNPSILALVGLFGALGGSLTAILSVIRGGTDYSIPQQLIQGTVVLIRPFFGAAAALAVYTFLGSGLVTVASNSTAAIFAVSFVAGFSEQLITNSVAKIAPTDGEALRR